MVGIACGMDESKQAIGDVLIPAPLVFYEFKKEGSQKISRGPKPNPSQLLLNSTSVR